MGEFPHLCFLNSLCCCLVGSCLYFPVSDHKTVNALETSTAIMFFVISANANSCSKIFSFSIYQSIRIKSLAQKACV